MGVRERWFVDGWEFTDGDVRDVEYRSGQLGTPPTRGDNAVVPNRSGQQWRPKVHDSGSFTLAIWFGGDQQSAQAMWDTILRAVVQPHRLTEYRRVTPSGESRYALGEVTASLSPTAIGQLAYRAELEVQVPRGYWRGDTLYSHSTPLSGAAGSRSVDLTDLAPSTAPLEDLKLKLDGQLVRPRITDATALGRQESLFYDATIADATSATFDCATWDLTGAGGHSPAPQAANYPGDRFLALAATPPGGVHRLTLTADTIGTNGRLTVSGYRSYLT